MGLSAIKKQSTCIALYNGLVIFIYTTGSGKAQNVIRTTYENALAAGDKNVYFINGDSIYAPVGLEYCTVDKCHPNDLGFFCMANAIEEVLRGILERD